MCQPPDLTVFGPNPMGARHSGVLFLELFTIVETGWKAMFSVEWMSLRASCVDTSVKSNHFLMASSPSRIAGILNMGGDAEILSPHRDTQLIRHVAGLSDLGESQTKIQN